MNTDKSNMVLVPNQETGEDVEVVNFNENGLEGDLAIVPISVLIRLSSLLMNGTFNEMKSKYHTIIDQADDPFNLTLRLKEELLFNSTVSAIYDYNDTEGPKVLGKIDLGDKQQSNY